MMGHSIRRKLIERAILIFAFVLLIIAAHQVVVRLFNTSANEIIIEYKELDALQNVKLSLMELELEMQLLQKHPEKTKARNALHKAEQQLRVCQKTLTQRHSREPLQHIDSTLVRVRSFLEERSSINEKDSLFDLISTLKVLDMVLEETKLELEEYESRNRTLITHSTATILSLSIIVFLVLVFGGIQFIRKITEPIRRLMIITAGISKGEQELEVELSGIEELDELAQSFKTMFSSLQETTVSKDYLRNVLNNLIDALIVTDENLQVTGVNNPTIGLFGQKESDILGKHIGEVILLAGNGSALVDNSVNNLKHGFELLNSEENILVEKNRTLPVQISANYLKKETGDDSGLIVLIHDLTDKKKIETELEQNRRERTIEINEAQEEERMRIATDLHDGLGQMLTAVSYAIQKIQNDKEAYNPASLGEIQVQIDNAIGEAKALSHNLIPIVLKDFGLIAAIEDMIQKVRQTHTLNIDFQTFDFNERLEPKLEKILYRICQESLNNILKHAEAQNVNVQLFFQDCCIVLVIDDDGIGFDYNEQMKKIENKGIGLIGIRERASSFDGTLTINTSPGNGTEIMIEIPYKRKKL